MAWWRQFWDFSFSVSSIASSLLIGVALGNLALGVPLDSRHEFAGSFWGLLHPYALLVGITGLALFIMHGTIYTVMKTEGAFQSRVRSWVNRTIAVFIICYGLTTLATLLFVPGMLSNLIAEPVMTIFPILSLLAVANIPREIHHGRDFRAFLSSSLVMAGLMATFGIGIYPNLIVSNPQIANSLTIYNAASSDKTLWIMLVIAMLGIPIVIAYTVSIYWIFRGKVKLDASSY